MHQLRVSLRRLEYFVAVAESGTISRAAERFRISQSAVSLAIAELERALEVQLFLRRKARGLTLTPAGSALLGQARRLLQHAYELQTSARSLGQELVGDLVIGCFPTLTPFVMPRILEEFPRRHPGVRIDFLEGSVAGLQQALHDGRCEVALMYDIGIQQGTATRALYQARPYVLLPAGHPHARQPAVRLADLADQPMIMIDMPPSATFFTDLLRTAGVSPLIRHRTTSFESVRSLVARGAGWSLLIQRPAVGMSYEGVPLAVVEVADPIEPVDVLLVTAAEARPTRRAAAFTEFCREAFGQPGSPSEPGAGVAG